MKKGKRINKLEKRVAVLEQEAAERNSMKASAVPPTIPGQPKRSEENDQQIRSSVNG
jgi:hypothetical protein